MTELGVLDQADFEKARTLAERLRVPLERTLVEQGRIPHNFLLQHLAQSWNVSFTELMIGQVKPDALRALKEDFARQHLVVSKPPAKPSFCLRTASQYEKLLIFY